MIRRRIRLQCLALSIVCFLIATLMLVSTVTMNRAKRIGIKVSINLPSAQPHEVEASGVAKCA